MSHTTCTLLGPFDPPERGRIATKNVTDTGFVMTVGQGTIGELRSYASRHRG